MSCFFSFYRTFLLMVFVCSPLCITSLYAQFHCVQCADNEDFDGDGVPNDIDLDDDNDGILDEYESFEELKTFYNGGFEEYNLGEAAIAFLDAIRNGKGWQTTEPDNIIEAWSSGFRKTNACVGRHFVELNANKPSRLFQVFKVRPGELIYYRVSHKGRRFPDYYDPNYHGHRTKPKDKDWMGIYIFPDDPNHPNRSEHLNIEPIQKVGTSSKEWKTYTGHYRVPEGVEYVQLGFMAISSASGKASVGNFIDNVAFFREPDSDNDGYPDRLDRDADGDGCWDCQEIGWEDKDNNGVPDYGDDVDDYGRLWHRRFLILGDVLDYSEERLKPFVPSQYPLEVGCNAKYAVKDLLQYVHPQCDHFQFSPDSIDCSSFHYSSCGDLNVFSVDVKRVLPCGRTFTTASNLKVVIPDCFPPRFTVKRHTDKGLCYPKDLDLYLNISDLINGLEDNCSSKNDLRVVVKIEGEDYVDEKEYDMRSSNQIHLHLYPDDVGCDYKLYLKFIDKKGNDSAWKEVNRMHISHQPDPLVIKWKNLL